MRVVPVRLQRVAHKGFVERARAHILCHGALDATVYVHHLVNHRVDVFCRFLFAAPEDGKLHPVGFGNDAPPHIRQAGGYHSGDVVLYDEETPATHHRFSQSVAHEAREVRVDVRLKLFARPRAVVNAREQNAAGEEPVFYGAQAGGGHGVRLQHGAQLVDHIGVHPAPSILLILQRTVETRFRRHS